VDHIEGGGGGGGAPFRGEKIIGDLLIAGALESALARVFGAPTHSLRSAQIRPEARREGSALAADKVICDGRF